MDIISVAWIFSIMGTLVLVTQKKLSGWWVFWSFFLGPLILIYVYFAPEGTGKISPDIITNLQTEITNLKLELQNLRRRITNLEQGTAASVTPSISTKDTSPSIIEDASTGVPLSDAELNDLSQNPSEEPGAHVSSQKSAQSTTPKEEEIPVEAPPDLTPDPVIEGHDPKPTPVAAARKTTTYQYNDSKEPSNAEINFGQFWLNKIGIVIFTLGVGFFISYSFQYFSPLLKDLLGYTVAGVLFYLGRRFEKDENLKNYGLALLGAGWALTYFTTYALHHFEASRVIDNQVVDMILLLAVAVGMMLHSLKAKSETMMMVSLGVAYVTSLIGEVTTFTFISSVILGCVVVFLLYRFQWIKTLFLGIGMTYGIHFIFVGPAIESGEMLTLTGMRPGPLLELAFLGAYWVLYFIGTHAVSGKSQRDRDCVAAGNFINFILFFVLSGPVFQEFYPDQRVLTLLIMTMVYGVGGVLVRALDRQRLWASDIVIAICAFTLAVYLEYLPFTGLMIWLIQTPFILFAGVKFKDKVLEYAANALTFLCLIRFIDVFDWGMGPAAVDVLGQSMTMMELSAVVGAVAMGACYAINRLNDCVAEVFAPAKIFCGLAVFYLTSWLWSIGQGPWLVLYLLIEVPVLLIAGRYAKENVLKVAGLVITGIALSVLMINVPFLGRSIDVDFLGIALTNVEWTYLFGSIALWVAFALSWPDAVTAKAKDELNVDNHVYSAAAVFLLNLWMWAILDDHWLTIGLTLEAVALVNTALLFALKRLRVYGYALLVIVLIRFFGVDDYGGLGWMKWGVIILELATFFGFYLMSFFKKEEKDISVPYNDIEIHAMFAGFMLVLLNCVFQYADWSLRSLCLGGAAVALISLGLWLKDKTARIGGFFLLAIALGRILIVDLARLTTIYKIISFIIIGALLLGLSFLYNKYFTGEKEYE